MAESKMIEAPRSVHDSIDISAEKNNIKLNVEIELTEHEEAVKKSYLWKVDTRVLPIIILLYFCASLDRSNIGVAYTNGLIEQLKFTTADQGNAVSIFTIAYTIFEAPSNILLKKFRPSYWFCFIVCGWSACCMFLALAKSSAAFILIRVALGAFESGFTPGITAYLPFWYAKSELGSRMSLFFLALPIAGMFGGPVAGALVKIKIKSLKPYEIIFLLEGAFTCIVGLFVGLALADYPDTAKFFTEEERELAVRRISASMGLASKSKTSNKQSLAALKDWKVYVFGFIGYGINNCLYIIQLYGPSIISTMGYSGDTATFYSGIPFAFGFVGVLIGVYYVNKIEIWKAYVVAVPLNIAAFAMSGFVYHNNTAKMAGLCLGGLATCGVLPFTATWMTSNCGSVAKRMVAIAIYSSIGGFAGIATPYIFASQFKPKYVAGNAYNLGLSCLTLLLVLFMRWYMARQNAYRDAHPVDVSHLSLEEQIDLNDQHPDFRYRL
ncbi:putative transporter [Smittium mucronatum]|uniref:Putative transporter n=1 Tax=Smittium mucronatum TaxID=133383 RepID=A0A1R0GWX7_9FUNG|nr:putative transporter [Smittium mucronatum]